MRRQLEDLYLFWCRCWCFLFGHDMPRYTAAYGYCLRCARWIMLKKRRYDD